MSVKSHTDDNHSSAAIVPLSRPTEGEMWPQSRTKALAL